MPSKEQLLQRLDRVDRIAKASKWQRLLYHPWRYLWASYINWVQYPRHKRSVAVLASTFFGSRMEVRLPAGTDIYLTGGKSHDSEIRLARLMIRQLQPGDTFWDIGAHYGFFSLLATRLVGEAGKVVSFEAAPSTYTVLAQNV